MYSPQTNMSDVLQCVQMKVSCGLVECVLQVKSKITVCCRCIWMLSFYLLFLGFYLPRLMKTL